MKSPTHIHVAMDAWDHVCAERIRLDSALRDVEALNERWVRAATNNYPANWAMDPGNPELTCANIREAPQAMADGYKAALEKTTAEAKQVTAERDALAARVKALEEHIGYIRYNTRPEGMSADQWVHNQCIAALTPPSAGQGGTA